MRLKRKNPRYRKAIRRVWYQSSKRNIILWWSQELTSLMIQRDTAGGKKAYMRFAAFLKLDLMVTIAKASWEKGNRNKSHTVGG